ncbi:MAG TPA: TonB-dependent receptor, partial [Segetibacter sp.]
DGKITYNVGESALSNGSSTAELLKSMPMIANDPNGKILLKGKEPKILIDDKPTDLSATQLADLLESMPGNSIEKIELMTNPPPQYASEAGGVINIVTKKGKIGWVGKIALSAGTRGEGNLSSNLSYRNKKFSFNTTLGVGASQLQGSNYSRRENIYRDSTNFFNTDGEFKTKNLRPNIRLQGDYEINKRNSINAVIQSNLNYFDNVSHTQYTNLNQSKQIYRLSTRENATSGNGYNHGLNLSYTHRGKNVAERLQIIAATNFGKNDNQRDFYQEFLRPDFTPSGLDSTQNQLTDNYSNAFSLRVNYDKPFRSKTKGRSASLTAGATFSRNNHHNILNTSFYKRADDRFVINDLLSTDFRFHQSIATARAGLNLNLKKEWRFVAGAQAEQTTTDFDFIQGNAADVSNSYLKILPHVTIRKEFSKTFNVALVYRSSIRRPGIGELNPSIDYNDPNNIRFGNPYLQPSVADNFDLNIGLSKGKYYLNGSLGYNKVKNIFNTIRTLVESGKTEVTYLNIADRNEYEASIWGGYTFSKKLRVNSSAGYSYNEYSLTERTLYKYRNGGTFYTSLNYNFTPNSLTTLDGNARYSSFSDPQGRARSNLSMNLGIQRKFLNKRLIGSFNIIDPFRVQQYTTYTYGKNFTLENFNSTNTRNFRISLAYQLNKPPQKKLSEKEKRALLNKLKKPAIK